MRPLQTDREIAIVPLSFSVVCFAEKNQQSYQIFLFFLVQMYYNSTTESIFVGKGSHNHERNANQAVVVQP